MVLRLEGARVIHVKMRFISVLVVYSPGSWVTHVTFHLSGVQFDHCRCQQTKIWWTPVGHQSLQIADFKLSNPVLWTEVVITILFSEQFPLIRYDIVRWKLLVILRPKWVRLREAPTEALKSDFVRGKIFLVWYSVEGALPCLLLRVA